MIIFPKIAYLKAKTKDKGDIIMALLEIHHYDHDKTKRLTRTKGLKKCDYRNTHKILVQLPDQEYGENGFEIVEGYLKLECRIDISCFDNINKVKADILKYNYENNGYEMFFVSDYIVDRIKIK